ncbi:MAG: amino acid ABC transporter permease [Nitrospinota bacterium]|nr:MAG: amino acid ABC transporter permease [Nitrospinota bacterium]
MEIFLQNFFNLETLRQVYPLLLQGLAVSAKLVVASVSLGLSLGLVIAVLYSLHHRWLNLLLIVYVDLLRSFPPLVLLILIYYGLPFLGLRLPEFSAAVLGLTLNSSSYYGEIFRAGLESIPVGQMEAARSTGLTYLQAMRYVILPQAIRNVIPPLTTNTLELIKATAIASAVALPELLRTARIAQGLVYNPTPLVAAALIYLVFLWPLARLVSRLEREMLAS